MIYVILCLYARFHGQTNAFLYSRKGADALTDNEHKWLVKERSCVFVALLFAPVYGLLADFLHEWASVCILYVVEITAAVFSFSYHHNNSYYLMRDKIDNTTHGEKHMSSTSTADINFDYKQRSTLNNIGRCLFVAGVLNLIIQLLVR